MSTKTFTFVRHAQSLANAGGVTMPHESIPLSEIGHRQAATVANFLATHLAGPPASVLVSSMVRTHQTAAPLCARLGLTPKVHPDLDEFSVIDPELIAGLSGDQRKPFVADYWAAPDPHRRLGAKADTFTEFALRVRRFWQDMATLPDSVLIFGHGIWFGLLHWLLLGHSAEDAADMAAFRRFQQSLPMPNCAVFSLTHLYGHRWSVQQVTKN